MFNFPWVFLFCCRMMAPPLSNFASSTRLICTKVCWHANLVSILSLFAFPMVQEANGNFEAPVSTPLHVNHSPGSDRPPLLHGQVQKTAHQIDSQMIKPGSSILYNQLEIWNEWDKNCAAIDYLHLSLHSLYRLFSSALKRKHRGSLGAFMSPMLKVFIFSLAWKPLLTYKQGG